jgi:hypothetical protein
MVVAAVVVVGRASPGRAEMLGVIIVPARDDDLALSDNLTEVAMARAAASYQVVGTAELRRRAGIQSTREIAACIERPACFARLAVSLGVTRVVAGTVGSEGNRHLLTLSLTDVASGRVEGRIFRRIDGGMVDLLRAVQAGIDELVDPARAAGRLRVRTHPDGAQVTLDDTYLGTTPLVSGPLRPGAHRLRVDPEGRFSWRSAVEVRPGQEVALDLGDNELRLRRRWPPYLAYGAAAGAILGGASGAVFSTLARIPPQGQNREEAQIDLHRRRTYGLVGITLLVSSGALALVSAVVFHRYGRDIVGE